MKSIQNVQDINGELLQVAEMFHDHLVGSPRGTMILSMVKSAINKAKKEITVAATTNRMKTYKATQSKINLLKAQIKQVEEGNYYSKEQQQKTLPILKKRLESLEAQLNSQIKEIEVIYEEL